MTQAIAGHGATIGMELDPALTPGSFTVVAELNGDIKKPSLNRPATEATPHQDTIDSHVTGRLGRSELSFSVNYIFDDSTHDHLTGLQKMIIDNTEFGLYLRGPGGAANTDEWLMSGFLTNFEETDPVREGVRTAQVTFRPSGPMKIDGVLIGTVV